MWQLSFVNNMSSPDAYRSVARHRDAAAVHGENTVLPYITSGSFY